MDISNREKEIWIELFVSIGVAIYYFMNAYAAGGFTDLANAELGEVIINAILISIVATIILSIIFRQKSLDAKDERDVAIEARGNSFAYYILCIFCTLIIGHIMISEGIGYFSGGAVVLVSSASIMHVLLVAMIVAGAVKSTTQIVCYRRGI